MSYIVTPFEVSTLALAQPMKVRFMHLFSAIATRHSDTIDCVFRVRGVPQSNFSRRKITLRYAAHQIFGSTLDAS
jgi:hypothetical protein